MKVISCLPNRFHPEDGNPVPPDLIGARILKIGTLGMDDARRLEVEGGGLVIDYIPEGEFVPRRVIFSFTELGMWLVKRYRLKDKHADS